MLESICTPLIKHYPSYKLLPRSPYWWLTGLRRSIWGSCAAAYRAIGAASEAASFINLVDPTDGTYDINNSVNPPGWTAALGWGNFSGTDLLEIGLSGIALVQPFSYLVRFNATHDATPGVRVALGTVEASGAIELAIDASDKLSAIEKGSTAILADSADFGFGVSRVACVTYAEDGAGRLYIDGALADSCADDRTVDKALKTIGCGYGLDYENFFEGSIQAMAFYRTTLTAKEVYRVSAAMAAL